MSRVVVIEEREVPRAASLLDREGISVERCPAILDVAVKVAQETVPSVMVLEVAGISPSIIRACAVLQPLTLASVVFCERGSERDVVDAYAAGAHVVITEPIGPHELVARLRAVLRRASMITLSERPGEVIVVGPVHLDLARRQVSVNGIPTPMPRKEFDIATVLMSRAGSVVTRVQLIRDLWGAARDTKTLDVQVGRLRAKLLAAEGRQRIITVRGLGYRFATDDELEERAVDEAATSPYAGRIEA
jgi:two-component system response regulator RegX3